MAEYPCDLHLARYSGPSTRCFLNLYRDDQAVFLRASVCPACLGEVVSSWFERSLYKTDKGEWDPVGQDHELEGLWQAQEWPQGRRQAPRRY